MNQKSPTLKDAATVILLNENLTEVVWAQRNPNIAFLGGFHAFPGGKLDEGDAATKVINCDDGEMGKFIACAARETFEEIGVLLARNGEKLTKGQRASLHDDLISGRSTFTEILAHWNLWIDAKDFIYTGIWTTPAFSPVRFKTRFFLALCPPKQAPYAAIGEMRNVEFIKPKDALSRWEKSEVLITPPALLSLKELSTTVNLRLGAEKLLEKSNKSRGNIAYIELNPRIVCFPLRTETLPPATHTNCFIVGGKEFIIIDAAARDKTEQNAFHEFVDSLARKSFVCREIIVSHLHKDHFGGETNLQKHLFDKFGWRVPLTAHKLTAESLRGEIRFDRLIETDETIQLKDRTGETFELQVLHAPGHASGHLCFYDEATGFLLTSDNVVGSGSVVIAPPEGNMSDYLESLEKMSDLPNLKFLCGSHGSAVFGARGKIEKYIAHRLTREREILSAFENGAKSTSEICEKVYTDVSPNLFKLAEKSIEAHLEKLKIDGRI